MRARFFQLRCCDLVTMPTSRLDHALHLKESDSAILPISPGRWSEKSHFDQIQGTRHSPAVSNLGGVGVDLGGFDISVTEEFLKGANIGT